MGPAPRAVDVDLRVKEEDTDYGCDERSVRRWKRRRIADRNFNAVRKTRNNSIRMEDATLYDKEYVEFLNCLENDHDGGNNSNAKTCGNSARKTRNNTSVQKEDTTLYDKEYVEFFNCPENDCDGDNDTNVNAKSADDGHGDVKISENNDQDAGPQHKKCLDDNDVWDPQYKMFLENLRQDGKSYALEVVINNEISVVIKYEKEDGLCDGLKLDPHENLKSCLRGVNTETARALKSSLKREKVKIPNNLGNVSSIERSDKTEAGRTLENDSRRKNIESPNFFSGVSSIEKIEMQRTMKHFLRRESMETPETLRDVARKESKNSMMDVNEENEDPSPGGTNGHLRKRSGTASAEVLHPAKRECNHEAESDMIDECYQKFLNCLENDGGNIVFMPENDIPMIYEGDVESSDDTEIIAMDKDPFRDGICSPFVASKINSFIDVDSKTCNGSPGSASHSQFRKRLMEVLRRPYNAKEYEELRHEVSHRKPMVGHRELRGGTIAYPTKSVGESYLDQHRGKTNCQDIFMLTEA
uniref:Uncharacterized protein n=1 Tax=Fagus sylvatica TaxID=28930 RepID=A0A2N9G0J6_FAGSY